MDKILDGKVVALSIKSELINELKEIEDNLKLVVIQIGNDNASNLYINNKEKICHELHIDFELIKFNDDIDEETVINKIIDLNKDKDVTGILLQLPIPKHLNFDNIINNIDPLKDVDGLTTINIGKLNNNQNSIVPCTALGIIKLLDSYNVSIEGKHVVILGRSILVGKPLISLLLNRDATVTICHSKTRDISTYTKQVDILISAVGKKHLINKQMIKDNAILIDVGINIIDGKLYGDIDYNDVFDKCLLITPVPGGIGPMTTVMLIYNLIECYKYKIMQEK